MSNVPAEVSAYFSKLAKDVAQNLSPEARHLRAQVAAEARWDGYPDSPLHGPVPVQPSWRSEEA
jgi:hypothetical protein